MTKRGFEERGYAVLRGLLPESARHFLYEYAVKSAHCGKLRLDDVQVPETPSCYSDPFMESALAMLLPSIEAASGLQLSPTYSYFRFYKKGATLAPHKDRPSCEVSVTLSLGFEADRPWPIWIERDGIPEAVSLLAGDGMLYKGIQLPHWREPFEGEHAAQVFLHYVDQNGPYREWKFDRRASLGTTPLSQRVMGEFGLLSRRGTGN